MAEDKLDTASDKDIFASAMADPPVEEKVVETPEKQPRDEDGKFASKPVEEKPKAEAPVEQKPVVEGEKLKPEEQKGEIPSWRLRESEDARRRAEQERDDFRQREAELRRRLAAAQPREQPKPIDLLENPDAWAESQEQRIEQRLLSRFLDASFEDAKEQHGEAFDKAWNELLRVTDGGDPSVKNRIINAGNPGRALMKWHQERETIREIGGDLGGYKKRLQEEAMKDPEFRKRAMEAWRDEASTGTNGQRPSVVTQLPSLNRAPGGSTLAADKEPETDEELFRSVGGGRRA